MMKKYIVARRELLAERDQCSAEEQRTKYATNPTYVYEAFKADTPVIKRLRDDHEFWAANRSCIGSKAVATFLFKTNQ